MQMRVKIKLNGKTITHKKAKEILGEERFERYRFYAEAGFWDDPLVQQDFFTPKGMMTFVFY